MIKLAANTPVEMIVRLPFATFIITICLNGCDIPAKKGENADRDGIYNEKLHQNYERSQVDQYYFEYTTFSLKEDQCVDNCAEVSVRHPIFDESRHKGFNQAIENQINLDLADFTLFKEASEGKEALAKAFITGYQEFKKEFPDVQTPWTVDISIEVSYEHTAFLSSSNSVTAYTGGAHPLSSRKYINLSKEGKRINSLDFFISDERKLTEIANNQFRAQHNIPPNQNLSDAGFSFENDQFSLPEQFGFSSNGMIFYYNSYEIASYAQGPTELVIPYSALEGIFKFLPQL